MSAQEGCVCPGGKYLPRREVSALVSPWLVSAQEGSVCPGGCVGVSVGVCPEEGISLVGVCQGGRCLPAWFLARRVVSA